MNLSNAIKMTMAIVVGHYWRSTRMVMVVEMLLPKPFHVAMSLCPMLCPWGAKVGVQRIRGWSDARERKFQELTGLVQEAQASLGSHSVLFRIGGNEHQAFALGSAWSLGGALICLGEGWFEKYDSLTGDKKTQFEAWVQRVRELPDDPIEVEKQISQMSSEQRQSLQEGAIKFKDCLTKEELSGIFRHELGHVYSHHSFCHLGLAHLVSILKYDKLLGWPIIFWMAQYNEREADSYCTGKFTQGVKLFFKRKILNQIDWKSPDKWAQERLNRWDLFTHPNCCKRLKAIHEGDVSKWRTMIQRTIALVGVGFAIYSVVGYMKAGYHYFNRVYQARPFPK